MRRILLSAALVLLGSAAVTMGQAERPAFSRYPAAVEKVRINGIDFKRNPDARTFRTRLSHALGGGVNFAGRYIIAGWGCGTGCTNAAIINARNGKVLWPDEFMNIDASYGDGYSEKQLDFRKNSRLLIIHGRPGTRKEGTDTRPAGDYYYEWRNERFRLIKFVEKN